MSSMNYRYSPKKSGLIIGTNPGGAEWLRIDDTYECLRAKVDRAIEDYGHAKADLDRSLKYGRPGPKRELKSALMLRTLQDLQKLQSRLIDRLERKKKS